MNVHEAAQLTESGAREYLESIRWPNGPACPHCGAMERQMRLKGNAHRAGLLKCSACREQYSVTVNTVMESSHIPLAKWVHAFHILCASKKGVSALQLQRMLGFGSYRTAWHMAHRIRTAMRQEPLASLLRGVVEVDETFVGGKPRQRAGEPRVIGGFVVPRHRGPAPDFADRKVPVVVSVQRNGALRATVTPNVRGDTLARVVADTVDPSAHLMTDERQAYISIGRRYRAHDRVLHSRGEFARGIAHVNTAESFNAVLKRSIVGAFHHVSRKHLQRYADETSFKWSHRKLTDGERTAMAIQCADGKKLTYRRAIAP